MGSGTTATRHGGVVASLGSAVGGGMLDHLQPFGFVVAETTETRRGATVRLANGIATVVITADWLEGEIEVTVGRIGEEGVAFGSLVPPNAARALHLRRLPRNVRTSVVEAQLSQVAELLTEHQRDLLSRT